MAILQLCTFLSICIPVSSSVPTFMTSIDMHIRMSTAVLMVCILIFMPGISWVFSGIFYMVVA